jgi:methylmalonyl-CoA/ethylmalonyl-CoA epimerase
VADPLANALGLGEPYHIGVAVRDLDVAVARFRELIGIGPWGRIDAEVPAVFRGAPTISGVRSAFARMGAMYIELVEPTVGEFPAKTFLSERGEGIYHIGYWVEDTVAALARAARAGIAVDWSFPSGEPKVAYLDASDTFGIHVEIVHTSMRKGIEDAIERAGAQPV